MALLVVLASTEAILRDITDGKYNNLTVYSCIEEIYGDVKSVKKGEIVMLKDSNYQTLFFQIGKERNNCMWCGKPILPGDPRCGPPIVYNKNAVAKYGYNAEHVSHNLRCAYGLCKHMKEYNDDNMTLLIAAAESKGIKLEQIQNYPPYMCDLVGEPDTGNDISVNAIAIPMVALHTNRKCHV